MSNRIGRLVELASGPRSIRRSAITMVEFVAVVAIASVVAGSILMATLSAQDVFVQSELISRVRLRAEAAMDRVVEMAGQALTTDPKFSPLRPDTGVNSHCLRFRLFDAMDGATGAPLYDDNARIYLYGPDNGASPCDGLIIGRGPTLSAISTAASGADGRLGTTDDDTSVSLAGGLPAVELLIPSKYAPQSGDMFAVNVDPAPIGGHLTFTLRLNVAGPDGNFLLENDLLITEEVALQQ